MNYWMKRRRNRSLATWGIITFDFHTEIGRLTANVERHDFRAIFEKFETIKESMESIYLLIYKKMETMKIKSIKGGKEIASCFETCCSGFYPDNPDIQDGLRRFLCGRFEIFEDDSVEGNVLYIETEDGPWDKIIFDNLACCFVNGPWYLR